MIATPQMALEAAAEVAGRAGVAAMILSDSIEGEAREVGKVMAGIARQVATHGEPCAAPCVLLSGRRNHSDRARRRPAAAMSNSCFTGDALCAAERCLRDGRGYRWVDGSEDLAGA